MIETFEKLDNPQELLASLGSFWTDTFSNPDQVESIVVSLANLEKQTQINFNELLASCNRNKVPVYHTERLYKLVLKKSEKLDADYRLPVYGEGYRYSYFPEIYYGIPIKNETYRWKIDEKLKKAPLILNRLVSTSKMLVYGADFFIEDDTIVFRENPFDQDFTQDLDYSGNQVVETKVELWLYYSEWDWKIPYNQFGYAIDLNEGTGETYKEFIDAAFDCITNGSNIQNISRVVSAICGVPLAKGAETVYQIEEDSEWLWVITDKNAYRFVKDSFPVVEVGDTVEAGDALTETLQFFEFNRGEVPNASALKAVSVAPQFFGVDFLQDLVFENKTVTPTITEDVDEYTEFRFEVGGNPLDVEEFWRVVHENGVAADGTLAMWLDMRTNKVGQPTATALPKTINPLQFLCENFFRYGLTVVVMQPQYFVKGSIGLSYLRFVRRLLSPYTALLFITYSVVNEDSFVLPADDVVEVFNGVFLSEDFSVPSDDTVRVTKLSGRCQ